MQPVC
jgi:putative transposase